MKSKAKRRLSDLSFESEGSSVALVSQSQGGPANGVTTLVTKSTLKPKDQEKVSREEIVEKASKDITVNMSIMEFLVKYLDLWHDDAEIVAALLGFTEEEVESYYEESLEYFSKVLESKMENISLNKSATAKSFLTKHEEFKNLLKKAKENPEDTRNDKSNPTSEGNDNMSEQETTKSVDSSLTPEAIQETIQKAVEEERARIAKKYEEEFKSQQEELQVLKAAEELRKHTAFKAEAESIKEVVGDTVDVEALAKSLRVVSETPEAKEALNVLKALKDTVSNSAALIEKGFGSDGVYGGEVGDEPEESKVEQLAKSYMKQDSSLDYSLAYVKAYDSIKAQQ